MGYDIGFHAIKKSDIDSLCDYVCGKSESIDLINKVLVARKSRIVANSWGLSLMEYGSSRVKKERENLKEQFEKYKPSLIEKMLGKKKPEPDYNSITSANFVGDFQPEVHIWGRPFLISDESRLNGEIRRYLVADVQLAYDMAKFQVEGFKSGISNYVAPETLEIPSDSGLVQNSRWKVDLLRRAYEKLKEGESVIDDQGEEHNAETLLSTDLVFCLVELASMHQPTWMARGEVWPSLLLSEAGSSMEYFEPASNLIESSLVEVANISSSGIDGNYSVGYIVSPENLIKFKEDLNLLSDKILEKAELEYWREDCVIVLKKVNECIDFCLEMDCYFVESSDIYSGSLGIIS